MKILFIIFGDLSSNNSKGRAFFNYSLFKYFKKDNNTIKLFCIDADKDSKKEFNVSTLLKNRLYLLLFKYGYLLRRYFKKWNERKFKEKIFDRFVSKRINPENYDIAIVTKPVVPETVEKISNSKTKIFSFATIAHPEFNRKVMLNLEKQYNIKINSNYKDEERSGRVSKNFILSDKIILTVNSPFLRNTYLDNKIPDEKIIEFNSDVTIDTNFFTPSKNKNNNQLTFLTLGYLNLIKGIPLLLEVWEQFKNKLNDSSKLIIAGPVSYDLKPIIDKYDLRKLNIEMPGKISRDKIVEVYNSADVFISPSYSDLGPETILEAMSCGLPVISSLNCGNSKYIEEGKNGFTYQVYDKEQLFKHLEWFSGNGDKIKGMGINARARVERIKNSDFFNDFYKFCLLQKN